MHLVRLCLVDQLDVFQVKELWAFGEEEVEEAYPFEE